MLITNISKINNDSINLLGQTWSTPKHPYTSISLPYPSTLIASVSGWARRTEQFFNISYFIMLYQSLKTSPN